MSVSFGYVLKRPLSQTEVLQLRDSASRSFQGYVQYDSSDIMHADLRARGQLPRVDVPSGLDILSVWIPARLGVAQGGLDLFRDMFERVQTAWGARVKLHVVCGFEDGFGSRQTRVRCDDAGIGIGHEGPFFSYSANNSEVDRNPIYRRTYFAQLARAVDLPLIVNETPRGYLLSHARGGCLHVNCADTTGHNHRTFYCGIAGASIDDLLSRMERLWRFLGARKILGYEWYLSNHEDLTRPMLGKEVYDWAVEARFPMQTASVDFSYRLRTLDALDGLKVLCGPKGESLTPLCRFLVSDEDWGELDVHTRADGHYLALQLSDPRYRQQVERALGLRFVDEEAAVAQEN